MTTPSTPPLSRRGWLSCGPITGNWLSAEFKTCCWACGSPASTRPKTVDSNNSSGNNDNNP